MPFERRNLKSIIARAFGGPEPDEFGPYRTLKPGEELPPGVTSNDVIVFHAGEHVGQRGIPLRAERRGALMSKPR